MTQQADNGDIGELGPPEYLFYQVLLRRWEQDNHETGRTNAHKLCVLTDHKLIDEYDRDVLLPTYWYRYGDTISENEINSNVAYRKRSDRTSGFAYAPAEAVSESDFDHLSESLKDDIYNAAKGVVSEHGDKTIKELEEHQYKNFRPVDFIEAYGDLRWYLADSVVHEDQKTLRNYSDSIEKSLLEDHLDKMLVSFPKQGFEDIRTIYLDWDDTIRMLYDQGKGARVLKDFTERFITGLAKAILRLKYNKNISEDRLDTWHSEKDDVLSGLYEDIQSRRKEALSQRTISGQLNSVSQPYNQSIFPEIDNNTNG